jgi:uncharacterized tellurite resistance protein B-like protein
MFDSLKSFLTDLGRPTERDFEPEDFRLAAVALLVHVANADGVIDLPERRKLGDLIAERFGLDEAATRRLIATAEQSDREAVDFYHFTSVLMRRLDTEGRHKIIEMMWDMAYADGNVDEIEENVIWRVAELLGISTRDRVMLRQRASHEADAATDQPVAGPWTRTADGEA